MANADSIAIPSRRVKDLTGKAIGRWTVLSYAGLNKQGSATWNCRCECGTLRTVLCGSLTCERSTSCGCLRDEVNQKRPVTHGKYASPTYCSWRAMLTRCYNRRNENYHRYGAHGVQVCERWRDSFEAFLEDMGERPSIQHSIDRYPDKGGNYEPGNCRWATRGQQNRNRRNNVMLTYKDETLCLQDWSARTGIDVSTLRARLTRGWTIEDAIEIPINAGCHPKGPVHQG